MCTIYLYPSVSEVYLIINVQLIDTVLQGGWKETCMVALLRLCLSKSLLTSLSRMERVVTVAEEDGCTEVFKALAEEEEVESLGRSS